MPRKLEAPSIVKECPRLLDLCGDEKSRSDEYIKTKYGVSQQTAEALANAISTGETSCGKTAYSRGICRSCYNAQYYDRSAANSAYEKSPAGRSRAAAYKRKYYQAQKESAPSHGSDTSRKRDSARREEFIKKFGENPDLSILSPKLRVVIERYYGLLGNPASTLADIGDSLQCSRQNVLILRDKAIALLDHVLVR